MNSQNSNDEEESSNFRNNRNTRGDNSVRNDITAADIPWSLKARYIGTGYVLGVFTAPTVRRLIAGLQPKLDQLLDTVTGQVEGISEKSSDFLARARDAIRTEARSESKSSCGDSCDDDGKAKATPPANA